MKVHSVLLLRVSSSVDKGVDHPQFFDPPYPLKYLQAGLKQYPDVQVRLLDCWIQPKNVSEMVEQTVRIQPDLVVVSASSFDVDIANDYVTALKGQSDFPLVVGIGQGYYPNGVRIKDFITKYDAILLGEPEEEFFRLFEQIGDAGGSNTKWKEHYQNVYAEGRQFSVEDSDCLPFPTYTQEELNAYRSIFPVFTFPVIPMVAKMLGYKPVFCEIDPETFNSGPEHIEAKITGKTGAVVATHLFGQPCPIRGIIDLARKRNIRVLEDCAHACGVRVDGEQVGTFGDIGVFSFAEGKNMPCFGGGAIATRDEAIAQRAQSVLSRAPLPAKKIILESTPSVLGAIGPGSSPLRNLGKRMIEVG